MKLLKVLLATALWMLPLSASAQDIHVYPGPDEDWNYLYDFGDVEVGASGVMIFQIECDSESGVDIVLDEVYLETEGPFTITDTPTYPQFLTAGESVYIEVTFMPGDEGLFESVMRIASNATIPPGTDIHYALRGVGIGYEPPPSELMAWAMDYYAAGLADETIYGLGNGNAPNAHIRVFGNMLDAADDLIAAGDYAGACKQLEHAALKSDGLDAPPDFIGGPGVPPLNAMIIDIMAALGC